MRKTILLAIMILMLAPAVMADGMIHSYYDERWNLEFENQQVAAINYQDGYENLLITIDVDSDIRGEKAVWIFPIPAGPDDTAIGIIKGFPSIYGTNIDRAYDNAVSSAVVSMMAYASFPIGTPLLFLRGFSRYSDALSEISTLNSKDGVVVHESIESMGLTTELITTKSQEALGEYLLAKGLNLPEASLGMLNEYVGKEYSFVVSFISDMAELKQETQVNKRGVQIPLGVSVKFPTEEMFFPLKPTSIYGSQEIPIVIYVIGHATPELYPKIKPMADVAYYTNGGYYTRHSIEENSGVLSFFNSRDISGNLKYTIIKINSPSKYYTEDLWIKNSAPASVAIKNTMTKLVWVWGILLFILLSMVASLLAGIVCFRKNPLSKKRLMLHGLWNCLTLMGFGIATSFMKTKEVDKRIQQQLKESGLEVVVKDKRKIGYFFLFYLFFMIIVFVAAMILRWIL